MTSILGINAYHPDASACILVDGKLVAAVEEERFTRIKHWAGFPRSSIEYCLQQAGLRLEDVEHIAINRNPLANLGTKVFYSLRHLPAGRQLVERIKNSGEIAGVKKRLVDELGPVDGKWNPRVHNVEHHCSHLASAFYPSPFEKAAVVSVDGFGDFVSTMWAEGQGTDLLIKGKIFFPHSLGLLYLAVTQFLGFNNYGDEFKVMALSAFAENGAPDALKQLVVPGPGGSFKLNLDYFSHHRLRFSMDWNDGRPQIDPVYSRRFMEFCGKPRSADEPLMSLHTSMAAGVQTLYEKQLDRLLAELFRSTDCRCLCLAGGCGQNSVANGKIHVKGPFEKVWVPPVATDAGGSLGAALWVWHMVLGKTERLPMEHAYMGPAYSQSRIDNAVEEYRGLLNKIECRISHFDSKRILCETAARRIAEGKVLGWFQGRMEWGPRALGNRSIVCDPRSATMRSVLNRKIKKRENFRPFAATVLQHALDQWYLHPTESPFMTHVLEIRKDKLPTIPAVSHVDGSGRVQTLNKRQNELFYQLVSSFERLTGVPMVLNTSMNENEPIVRSPEEALKCYLRTAMDCLVIGDCLLERVN